MILQVRERAPKALLAIWTAHATEQQISYHPGFKHDGNAAKHIFPSIVRTLGNF